jgi:hypothetical protein
VLDHWLGLIRVHSYTDCMCERTERGEREREREILKREKVKKC